jgi:hypothetical protein
MSNNHGVLCMDKPFGMDRPIQDKRLARTLKDIQKVLRRADYAGYVMLIAPDEMAWTYCLATSWSAIYSEPGSDFGVRIRAAPSKVPEDVEKLRLAAYTFVNMLRAGNMLNYMATSFIKLMEDRGISVEFEREEPPNIIGLDVGDNQ